MIQFPITIGHAYFFQGFVNIGVLYANYFPDHGVEMNVYLGDWGGNHLTAWVNREANPNNAPRIMMGIQYTDWVQRNHNIGGQLIATILAPDFPNSLLLQ